MNILQKVWCKEKVTLLIIPRENVYWQMAIIILLTADVTCIIEDSFYCEMYVCWCIIITYPREDQCQPIIKDALSCRPKYLTGCNWFPLYPHPPPVLFQLLFGVRETRYSKWVLVSEPDEVFIIYIISHFAGQ